MKAMEEGRSLKAAFGEGDVRVLCWESDMCLDIDKCE